MTQKTKTVIRNDREITSVICDVCKKEYKCEEDILEVQEFHHIEIIGGFNSVFGDMNKVRADICQHCLYEWIKDIYW